MDCPQCEKKAPDNMKFCGWCGIELEGGTRRTIEEWTAYLQTELSLTSGRRNRLHEFIVGLTTLGILSAVTAMTNVPDWNSNPSYVLLSLGLVGMLATLVLMMEITKGIKANGAWDFCLITAYRKALNGKLNSTKDFLDHFALYEKSLGEFLNYGKDVRGRFWAKLPPEELQSRLHR